MCKRWYFTYWYFDKYIYCNRYTQYTKYFTVYNCKVWVLPCSQIVTGSGTCSLTSAITDRVNDPDAFCGCWDLPLYGRICTTDIHTYTYEQIFDYISQNWTFQLLQWNVWHYAKLYSHSMQRSWMMSLQHSNCSANMVHNLQMLKPFSCK